MTVLHCEHVEGMGMCAACRGDEPKDGKTRYVILRLSEPSAVDSFIEAKKREEQERRKTLVAAADICEAEGRREMGAALRRMAW